MFKYLIKYVFKDKTKTVSRKAKVAPGPRSSPLATYLAERGACGKRGYSYLAERGEYYEHVLAC